MFWNHRDELIPVLLQLEEWAKVLAHRLPENTSVLAQTELLRPLPVHCIDTLNHKDLKDFAGKTVPPVKLNPDVPAGHSELLQTQVLH